ncbi:MAG: substrate-binding domain-containing protein [Candidatus Accumulibacter sp.]|nr:substrate-binding domain-containing protein [Accumulibacter sp.]
MKNYRGKIVGVLLVALPLVSQAGFMASVLYIDSIAANLAVYGIVFGTVISLTLFIAFSRGEKTDPPGRFVTQKYCAKTIGLTLFALPLAVQAGLVVCATYSLEKLAVYGIVFGVAFLIPFIAFLYGKKADLPDSFLARYAPFIAPIVYFLLAWILYSLACGGDFTKINDSPRLPYLFVGLFWPFASYLGVLFVASFTGDFWICPLIVAVSQMILIAAFALGTRWGKRFATRGGRHAVPTFLLVPALMAVSGAIHYAQYLSVFHDDPEREVKEAGSYSEYGYWPFAEDSELVRPRKTPSLVIERDYPRLDGAIALLPVYGAAARAIYARENGADGDEDARKNAVECTNTPGAYERLIAGETEMIFVAAPSAAQRELAERSGVRLTLTPIGREAFVFLVNEQNPVKNLSVDQIRAIYRGEIDDWSALGGPAGKILAFQRNPDSGSQSTMEQLVMRGAPMRKALEAEYHASMGGIIRAVADYRNYANAIGYSFRYYATAMNTVPGVGLLSVNGVAPTVENIRDGAYPFVSELYIVTARPLSENARKLRDWFLGDEGQQLIADVGYVPIKRAADESR